MPISPDKMHLYPGGGIHSPEWLAIVEQVRARSGNRCEKCGLQNGLMGFRAPNGEFIETPCHQAGDIIPILITTIGADGIPMLWEREFKVFRLVLTVAHLDCELTDHRLENLRHWCQQDHNRHDAEQRARNAAATRKARQPVTLLTLMGAP